MIVPPSQCSATRSELSLDLSSFTGPTFATSDNIPLRHRLTSFVCVQFGPTSNWAFASILSWIIFLDNIKSDSPLGLSYLTGPPCSDICLVLERSRQHSWASTIAIHYATACFRRYNQTRWMLRFYSSVLDIDWVRNRISKETVMPRNDST